MTASGELAARSAASNKSNGCGRCLRNGSLRVCAAMHLSVRNCGKRKLRSPPANSRQCSRLKKSRAAWRIDVDSTILVTGFGPFPSAPFNPTGTLVERLARLRRPALAGVAIIPHVFQTSYAAVDRDLPKLIARHKPDALLMFGLAPRAKSLRIETRARNALGSFPDVSRSFAAQPVYPDSWTSGFGVARIRARHLLAAARSLRVPVVLSRDAGRYLCNYLCWRATEAAMKNAPRIVSVRPRAACCTQNLSDREKSSYDPR